MAIARIENGAVVEFRDFSIEDVPPHKRALWLPVVEIGEGPQRAVTVEAERVVIAKSSYPAATALSISDRQFFQQLAHLNVITNDEALAAVGPGEVPAAMLAMVAALPEAEQFAARMLLTGATSFDRGHPLVAVFGEAFGWTTEQLDEFWIAAAAL